MNVDKVIQVNGEDAVYSGKFLKNKETSQFRVVSMLVEINNRVCFKKIAWNGDKARGVRKWRVIRAQTEKYNKEPLTRRLDDHASLSKKKPTKYLDYRWHTVAIRKVVLFNWQILSI